MNRSDLPQLLFLSVPSSVRLTLRQLFDNPDKIAIFNVLCVWGTYSENCIQAKMTLQGNRSLGLKYRLIEECFDAMFSCTLSYLSMRSFYDIR